MPYLSLYTTGRTLWCNAFSLTMHICHLHVDSHTQWDRSMWPERHYGRIPEVLSHCLSIYMYVGTWRNHTHLAVRMLALLHTLNGVRQVYSMLVCSKCTYGFTTLIVLVLYDINHVFAFNCYIVWNQWTLSGINEPYISKAYINTFKMAAT